MSGQHTQGRLVVDPQVGTQNCIISADDNGASFTGYANNTTNARRLAACWNAFEGIATQDIEQGQILLEICGKLNRFQVELAAANARTAALEAAIDKLAACKGRFQTEQNFVALMAVRGASTPAPSVKPSTELAAARALLREVLAEHDARIEAVKRDGDYPVPNPFAERIRAHLAGGA